MLYLTNHLSTKAFSMPAITENVEKGTISDYCHAPYRGDSNIGTNYGVGLGWALEFDYFKVKSRLFQGHTVDEFSWFYHFCDLFFFEIVCWREIWYRLHFNHFECPGYIPIDFGGK